MDFLHKPAGIRPRRYQSGDGLGSKIRLTAASRPRKPIHRRSSSPRHYAAKSARPRDKRLRPAGLAGARPSEPWKPGGHRRRRNRQNPSGQASRPRQFNLAQTLGRPYRPLDSGGQSRYIPSRILGGLVGDCAATSRDLGCAIGAGPFDWPRDYICLHHLWK
jgi:hypothetical protein